MSTITVLYEDDDLLVINKPAGLVVNRAQTVADETLQDWLEVNVPAIQQGVKQQKFTTGWQEMVPDSFEDTYGTPEEIFIRRSGIAHRLDKDTSGALVVAKSPGSLVSLLKQFKERTVQKEYQCLVHGKFALQSGEIAVPIGRRTGNRKLFGVVADGRASVTNYQVISEFSHLDIKRITEETGQKQKRFSLYESGFSLVQCYPKTGRTHQIRVHMTHTAHPIVGDSSYAGKKRSKLDKLWCKRQFLHAYQITFRHPRQEVMTITADLASDLQEVLTYLS